MDGATRPRWLASRLAVRHGECVRELNPRAATDNATSPYVCRGMREHGNSFLAPVFGSSKLNVLRQLHMQHRVLRMLRQHERGAARQGKAYTHVCWSRLEFDFLRPHPPLTLLLDAAARSEPRCDVWVPLGEDCARPRGALAAGAPARGLRATRAS